jgi:hypothetical protein
LDRDPLLIARTKIVEDYLEDLKAYIEARILGKIDSDANLEGVFVRICQKIIGRADMKQAYSLWGNFINSEIESLIAMKLPTLYRQCFRTAYQNALHP